MLLAEELNESYNDVRNRFKHSSPRGTQAETGDSGGSCRFPMQLLLITGEKMKPLCACDADRFENQLP
jgi:hypothetical protein